MKILLKILLCGSFMLVSSPGRSDAPAPPPSAAVKDEHGASHGSAFQIPSSDLASKQSMDRFIENQRLMQEQIARSSPDAPIGEVRRTVDEGQKPGFDRLMETFDVSIRDDVIGGVPVRIISPKHGVSRPNADRVLIELHGGGMAAGWTYGALEESIPISAIGAINVVAVNYRMFPEVRFPAASDDVGAVYKALLKRYKPENIGIYGCSAGAEFTGQTVAWLVTHHMRLPGAIGMFGYAPVGGHFGDSNYMVGGGVPYFPPGSRDPGYAGSEMVLHSKAYAPALYDTILRSFPPSLLVSGTRDIGLSAVVYTHSRLVALGVPAELHVWEGQDHCAYAQAAVGITDPDVPENREAWNVITHFFAQHLGHTR